MSRILVALDPDLKADQPALNKAVRLATACNANLDVLVNMRSRSLERHIGLDIARLEAIKNSIRGAWQKRIDKLAKEAGVTVHNRLLCWDTDTYEALMSELSARPADLLVVHTHYEPQLKRLLFTPLEWKLVREAVCPTLFVGEQEWTDQPQLVAAVDPPLPEDEADPLGDNIIASAQRLSRWLGGRLDVAHAVEYPDESLLLVAGEAIPTTVETEGSERELYESRLAEICRRHDLGDGHELVLEGDAARALARYMNDRPGGILVMGTAQKSPMERFLLGSTAEQILYRITSDVLVLKPDHQLQL